MSHHPRSGGIRNLLLLSGFLLVCVLLLRVEAAPVPVIFDCDMAWDVDDAGALAILNALADLGEADILAAGCCTGNACGAPCINTINTYYSRGAVPVGTAKDRAGQWTAETYNCQILSSPHTLQSGLDAPEAYRLYRQVLALQPDTSVTFVCTGPMGNLALLLKSGADAYSQLTGTQLVARKAKNLVVMGGGYPSGGEFNFTQDGASSQYVAANWPAPAVFSGVEIGNEIFCGLALVNTSAGNPVRKAYQSFAGYQSGGNPPGCNREAWDLTAVLYAVRGAQNYWDLVSVGYNQVNADGTNQWLASPDKNHSYLVKKRSPAEMGLILDTLLCKPPIAGSAVSRGADRHPVAVSEEPRFFRAGANVGYELSRSMTITVDLLNIEGRLISRLFSGDQTSGRHVVSLETNPACTGLYFVRARYGGQSSVMPFVFAK